jgi:hypothetical protein
MNDESWARPGIDEPPDARILEAHALDGEVFELAHRHAAAEVGDLGGRRVGVHRAADEGQRARLRLGVQLREVGGGGERERHGLADGHTLVSGPMCRMKSIR